MNIRIDDDMRAIVSFTPDEYEAMGGDKDAVAAAVEQRLTFFVADAPSIEEPKSEPIGAPEPPAVAALDAPVN